MTMKYNVLQPGLKKAFLRLLLAVLASLCADFPAEAGAVAQSPLFLTPPVKPNIMLMLDNSGSMNNIVPESPYDPAQTYINCPAANQLPPCSSFGCVQIRIAGGAPLIYDGSANWRNGGPTYTLGTGAGQKCFNPAGTYAALLIADNNNNTAPAFRTGDADYTGNYLNWYFNAGNTAWNGSQKPGTQSRMEIAKQAAVGLVDSLEHVRLGLSAYYNSQDGGALLDPVEDIDDVTNKKADIKAKINALLPENNTPLAETLSDIGHYFATGYAGDLTLHPGKANQAVATVESVFTQGTVSGHNLHNSSGKTVAAPIESSCQKSFAVLMTDGRPQLDRDISASLRDYTGDCAAGLCDSTPTAAPANETAADALPPAKLTTINFKNGTKIGQAYEWAGSDYLDDVAQALFEMDLRPDLVKSKKDEINNLRTYTIGFADPILANDPLLRDAAERGGGQFKTAENSTQLSEAFQAIIADIQNQVAEGSATSLSANSTRLDTATRIYQAGFNSTHWTGTLKAFKLVAVSEDTNENGLLDTGEDTNSNGKLDLAGSAIEPAEWAAESLIPAAASRRILSYNPDLSGNKGISFEWANLNNSQKAALDPATGAAAPASQVLDYIRGDKAKEKASGGAYRDRTTVLGDIVNSDPLVVSNTDDFGYSLLEGDEGATYTDFRETKSARTNAIYVGANDGMLHAFNADSGVELFAYIPNAVVPALNKLTDPLYGCRESGCLAHEYFIDGAPRAGDAYFAIGSGAASWRTLLLGSTGAGSGKAIFALDITDPNPTKSTASSAIGEDKVLWELSPDQAPVSTDLADDNSITPARAGLTNNLGYTIPQPSLVRMHNNAWAAVVANGYNSVSKKAVLYILNAATGAIIRSIDTQKGSDGAPNGLSSPIPIDADGDRVTDFIYAGDLLGNLWKFDVQSDNPANWAVAFASGSTPAPLLTACSGACDGANYQPITAKPQVGRHPKGGLMVYFGTGKYFEAGDQIVGNNPEINSFYGVRDQGIPIVGRSRLQEQAILAEAAFDLTADSINDIALRATSNNAVDYTGNPAATPAVPAKQGWYMDLISPVNAKKGERVVSQALLRNDKLIFITMTPSSDTCIPGGSSWFMDLDAVNGKRLETVGFDTNNDGLLNNSDKKAMDANLSNTLVNMSGIQMLDSKGNAKGMVKSAVALVDGKGSVTYELGDDKRGKTNIKGDQDESAGRQSWRQIQ